MQQHEVFFASLKQTNLWTSNIGADGNQMAFWTCYSDRVSKKHTHEFDEYMVCVSGQYTAVLNEEEFVLNPGDELFIPKGTEQWGKCIAGTRTIHAFDGKRINRVEVTE